MTRWWIVWLAAFLVAPAAAQTAPRADNPSLTALSGGVRDEEHVRDISLRRFDLAVVIRGAVATATVTASFNSKARDQLEGEFRFALPEGAVVTGYALDVDGRMLDGVLVDRPRAKAVYETQVRGRIDPGLGEVVAGNVFQTRVFPILPGKGRTIRLSFAVPVPVAGLRLPIRIPALAEGWSIAVAASGVEAAPTLVLPGMGVVAMSRTAGAGYTARADGRAEALDGDLVIGRAATPATLASRHASGDRFLQLSGSLGATQPAARPARVRLYWDRSRSRLASRRDAEIALVERVLTLWRPAAIELVVFNAGGAQRWSEISAAAIVRRLRAVRYGGATGFAAIAGRGARADRCLLVSDGQVTIDRAATFAPDCPVDAVASSPDADTAQLRILAQGLGGRLFMLGQGGERQVAEVIAAQSAGVTAVIGGDGRPAPFVALAAPVGCWAVLVQAPGSGAVTVRTAAGTSRHDAGADITTFDGDGDGALIAADRLAALGATDRRSDYIALSRRYGIASASLSFVVLETPSDYVTADITPPASYPPDLRKTYLAERRQADKGQADDRAEHLADLVVKWADQVEWWKRRPESDGRSKRDRAPPESAPPPPPPPPPSPPSTANESSSAMAMPIVAAESDDNITVTGSRIEPTTRIEIDAWQPDRPYLKRFDATPARFDALFAAEERRHGSLPAFYLDTAEWLRRRGRGLEAPDMVLSALELPSANEVTLGIVADRLERYGQIDRAVELRERQAALDPDRPQPRRLLALALARRAVLRPATARTDLQRAVDLLSEVALRPWSAAWEGIDIIALMEVNALIPRLRALGGTVTLDRRLIALLDVDVRVVIDWTTDANDLDLWIDEPGGERAIYDNPATAIGGRLSNDMTSGYGPEEYLLRRAPVGTYVVQANVFASDRIDPNGAALLTAHLIRDFGRPTQHEESIDVELSRETRGSGNDDEKMIGRLIVGPRSARPRAKRR